MNADGRREHNDIEDLKAQVAELREKVASLEGELDVMKASQPQITLYPAMGAAPMAASTYYYTTSGLPSAEWKISGQISGSNWMGT